MAIDNETLAMMIALAKAQGGGGGASSLSELSDIDLYDLHDGDYISYDEVDEKWYNHSTTGISDLARLLVGTDYIGWTYNSKKTYNKGDYITQNRQLYKCKEDNVTGTWVLNKWQRVWLADELRPLTLIDTLTAGQTTLTISNESITTTSTFRVYTSVYGPKPTDIVASDGSITLTFTALAYDLGVKVEVL